MACACRIAERRGLLAPALRRRITGVLGEVGLPVTLDGLAVRVDPVETLAALGQIRKIRDGRLRFVLPMELGETVIADDVTDEEIHTALTATASEGTSGDGGPGEGQAPSAAQAFGGEPGGVDG
jgi:3-dehydroquinate synthase